MKKDEKPFDSQFLSRIFRSDAKAESEGRKEREGDQGCWVGCVEGVWEVG